MDAISEHKEEWKRIDQALIPADLLCSMPQPECKGLTLLTDVMINATVCKLGPRVGLITAPYSDDIEMRRSAGIRAWSIRFHSSLESSL